MRASFPGLARERCGGDMSNDLQMDPRVELDVKKGHCPGSVVRSPAGPAGRRGVCRLRTLCPALECPTPSRSGDPGVNVVPVNRARNASSSFDRLCFKDEATPRTVIRMAFLVLWKVSFLILNMSVKPVGPS